MYLDDTKVQLLLEKHRDAIGVSNLECVETIFSGILFIVSNVLAEYNVNHYIEILIRLVCFLVGLTLIGRGVYLIMKNLKNKYCHIDLYKDLQELDQITHPFSIIAIMDTFNAYPNRFLLYHDERWNCDFFFNYRTKDCGNSQNIIEHLSRDLHIDSSKISLDFKTVHVYEKFSESDQEKKLYEHRLYCATISEFTNLLMQDRFEIDGKYCKWVSIANMEKDEHIRKKNMDVVELVKEYI